MTIYEWQRYFLEKLDPICSSSEASSITSMILKAKASVTRADIIKNPGMSLLPNIEKDLQNALSELLIHKPVQYVIGSCWFNNMEFNVNEHVLIPRPETEELVNLINKNYQDSNALSVLDIGTGSGCIPVSIKKNNPTFSVSAIDISPAAIAIAQTNSKTHSSAINFIELDFLNKSNWNILEKYDIIVSNPPYIPESDKKNMEKNVLDFEPHLALFVPESTPLVFYEAIMRFGKTHLNVSGKIFMEIHASFGKEIEAMFKENEYDVEVIKDMYGKDRFEVASLCL